MKSFQNAFDLERHSVNFELYRGLSQNILDEWTQIVKNCIRTGITEKSNLVDAGCGTGRFSIPISKLLHPYHDRLYSIDRSEQMLNVLKAKCVENNIDNISPILGDIESIELLLGISGVFISEVLHLINNPELLLSRINASLNPNGWIVIRTPSHVQLKKIEWLRFFPNALEIDLARTTDVNQIIAILGKTGFINIQTQVVDESIRVSCDLYKQMLVEKAYSILYSFNETDLRVGYQLLDEYIAAKDYCKHTMELTCITAYKK